MRNRYINHKRGAAIITVVMFFVIIATTMAVGLSSPVVREYKIASDFEKSKGAYYLSEAGHEDAVYRTKKGKPISAQEVIFLGGNTATTTITTTSAGKSIRSIGDILTNTRRVKSTLTTTSGVSFNYGVQAGEGGVFLKNGSTITGNLYSAGPVCGGGGTGVNCISGSGTNLITGSIISTGTTGLNGTTTRISNQSGASMYAGVIQNSIISGSAHCNSISGSSTTTCKTLFLQPPADLPITRANIENWETIAATGGSVVCVSGKYTISDTVSIGPKKIPCMLEIKGNNTVVTLTGHIWATGNIEIENDPNIKVDPTFAGQSIVLIADNQSNTLTDSKIILKNNATFTGATGGNSWVLLLSENTSALVGGSERAIDLLNNAAGDLLLYARLGNINLQNNASVKEVTGYKISLENNANVIYTSGLENALFAAGPGGTWNIQDWKEGQ